MCRRCTCGNRHEGTKGLLPDIQWKRKLLLLLWIKTIKPTSAFSGWADKTAGIFFERFSEALRINLFGANFKLLQFFWMLWAQLYEVWELLLYCTHKRGTVQISHLFVNQRLTHFQCFAQHSCSSSGKQRHKCSHRWQKRNASLKKGKNAPSFVFCDYIQLHPTKGIVHPKNL